MNVALRESLSDDTPRHCVTRDIEFKAARIDVYDDLATAQPAWQTLIGEHAAATPYQRYEWVALWHEHVSRHQGMTPLIIVGRDDDGSPLFLWPFAKRDSGSLVTASYFGERHANLNGGLWTADAAAMTAADITGVLTQVARRHAVDLFALFNQPLRIGAIANPFAQLSHQNSPDDVYVTSFDGHTGEDALKHCVSAAMRGRLRTKERKLKKLPGYRYAQAATADDVERIFDAFLVQKAAHFAVQGIENVFAAPEVVAFLRAACHEGLAEGRPVIELHALEGGGEVIAVFGGVNDGRRMSCMFNSYTLGENGRWSPGLILLTHLIENSASRGLVVFDLGAGYADYKSFFCKNEEGLFDSFLPFSARGQLGALGLRTAQSLKRWVKATPFMWDTAKAVRRRLFG